MSDDESFVVLGSSPFSSLNGKNISNKNNESLNQEIKSASLKGNSINSNLILKNSLDETQNDSFEQSIKPEIKNDINSQNQDLQSLKGSSIEEKDNSFEKSGMSMAASFLLGQIEPSTMKDSVYSHFPSVNESFKSKEDIVKLQSLITSNIEMKDTLRKTNETMNEWMKKTKRTMEIYEQKLKGFQEKTDSLEEENKFLQKQLFEKVQQIEILEIKRNEEFENNISEKENKLYQLQQQILKLEEHQKNSKDLLNERKSYCEQSCVPKISHIKIVEELENKISTILAENLEIKDMQKQYIDEINCLKVNYTSLEELYKKATADIECLRNKESMKTNVLNDYEIKFKDINEEMKILQIQVETYRKDFESERESRQNMAGERDYLLVELKKLQQNNQKLIEDAELKLSKQTNMQKDRIREAQQNSKTPLNKESQVYQRVSYICPLCNRDMKTLVALQDHVQACLDEKN